MDRVVSADRSLEHDMQQEYRYLAAEVVQMLESDAERGLTTAQAEQHLQRYGANTLPEPAVTPAWRRFLSQFQGPLTVLLLLAIVVSVFAWLNERDTPIPFEALTILIMVLLNGILGYIQENRAEQAVAALQAMSTENARVLRDGEQQNIPTAQVVAGDILLIEEGDLLTDSGPALALGVDTAERGIMRRPPRNPRSRIISKRMWFDIVFVGAIMAAGTLLIMDWALPGGLLAGKGTLHYAQTMAFTTLVLFQLFNVFNTRSAERSAFRDLFSNKWLWLAVLVSVVLQICVVYLPLLQVPFETVPLRATDWLFCIGVASCVVWFYELLKLVRHSSEAIPYAQLKEGCSYAF